VLTLRLGERWKRRGGGATDEVWLEVEGVSLLPPLEAVDLVGFLSSWLSALESLIVRRARTAQVSLDDSALEVCLWRRPGTSVEVTVVSPSTAQGVVAGPFTVDLVELRAALEVATRAFLRAAAESSLDEAVVVQVHRRLRDATGRAVSPSPDAEVAPWTFRAQVGEVAIECIDTGGRSLTVEKDAPGLAGLLMPGEVRWGGERLVGPPFITLLGLARRSPTEAVLQAGLGLCAALAERHPGWATNAWVALLFTRCTEGLATLRQPVPESSPQPEALPPNPGGAARLSTVGSLRRLTLSTAWTQAVTLGEAGGQVSLSRRAIVVHSATTAAVFSIAGQPWRRLQASRGVAASPDGTVIAATESHVTCFVGDQVSARWVRDTNGLKVGPGLALVQGRAITSLGGRGVLALEASTGREAFRFDPQRTQRSVTTVLGARAVVGTDGGDLYGVDVRDGQVRFKVQGGQASRWPVSRLRSDAVAVLSGSTQATVACFAALPGKPTSEAGSVRWSLSLSLEHACGQVISGGRIFVAGGENGHGVVACLSTKGARLWQRPVPLDAATCSLIAFSRGVIVTDSRGASVRLLPDGSAAWVLGALDEPLAQRLAPTLSRRVLVVPGVTVRLIEPGSGLLLAMTPAQPELTGYAVSPRLSIFTWVEGGLLTCLRPGVALSVVD